MLVSAANFCGVATVVEIVGSLAVIAEPAADSPPVSAGLEREDLARRIAAALERLDARYCEVVVLADMQDASYEEIAETLAIPIGTVRSRLHRGRTELRALLATR